MSDHPAEQERDLPAQARCHLNLQQPLPYVYQLAIT